MANFPEHPDPENPSDPMSIVGSISKREEIFSVLFKSSEAIRNGRPTMASEFSDLTTDAPPTPPPPSPSRAESKRRFQKIRNPLNQKQREMAKRFMDSMGWIQFRTKPTREKAKRFCEENGIGDKQFKYWLEYSRKVRRSKGLPTK